MSKGWAVVVLVLVAAMAMYAVLFAGARSMKLDKRDMERSRNEILGRIPLGSNRAEAAHLLKEQGFVCELLDGLMRDGRRSRALNCSRATWTGIGRWRIGVWLDGETEMVEDVTVSYGNTAF